MTSRIIRMIAWMGVAAIIVLSLLPGDLRPNIHPFEITQFEHVSAYIVTGAALALGYADLGPRFRSQCLIGLFLMILAAILEASQIWIPGRHARVIDWAAGAFGGWVGIGIVLLALWAHSRLYLPARGARPDHR
jgi:VanZ family protein